MASSDQRIVSGRYALGARIRAVRIEVGLSMLDAANDAGISYSYLSDVERGRQLPPLEALDRIASILHTSVLALLEDLFPWDGDAAPTAAEPPPDARRKPRSAK